MNCNYHYTATFGSLSLLIIAVFPQWLSESCCHQTLCDSMDYSPWNSLGQNTGVGSLSLLQGIYPIKRSNRGFPNCGRILYQLSHKGSLWPVQNNYQLRISTKKQFSSMMTLKGNYLGNIGIVSMLVLN